MTVTSVGGWSRVRRRRVNGPARLRRRAAPDASSSEVVGSEQPEQLSVRVERTSGRDREPQPLGVPVDGRAHARGRVPRAPVGARPAQTLDVAVERGAAARGRVPRTARPARVLQTVRVAAGRRRRSGAQHSRTGISTAARRSQWSRTSASSARLTPPWRVWAPACAPGSVRPENGEDDGERTR